MNRRAAAVVVDERGLLLAPGTAGEMLPVPSTAAAKGDDSSDVEPWLRPRTARLLRRAWALVARGFGAETERGLPFLLAPVVMGLGALAYFAADGEPGFPVIVAAAFAAAAMALLARERPHLRLLALGLLLLVVGALAAKTEVWRAGTQINGSPVATALTGRVVQVEHQATGRTRVTLDVLATARPELSYAPDRVRLTARAVPEGTAPGTVLHGYARLMPPSGPVLPGGYDFAFESYFDGRGAIGFYQSDPELASQQPDAGPGARLAAMIEAARLGLAVRVESRIEGPAGDIAAALIAGVRAGIPEEINEALRRTGLAHVLSISGLHMALVALTVMGTLRIGFALAPGFAMRHPVKKYASAVALVACAIYLVISGNAVAAQRSFIMLAVMLVALLFDRAALTMRNLAIAALAVLALSPHEIVGPSFQMSFAATAALIGGYAAWTQFRMARMRGTRPVSNQGLGGLAMRKVIAFVGGLALTSIIAGLATTVYGMYHFHRVSTFALVANLLAMPIVSIVVMPMAVLGVVLMPLGLDWAPLWLMGKGIDAMNAVAFAVSERTPIDVVGLMPLPAMLAMTAALLAATLFTSWARLVSLPLAMVGLMLVADRTLPDVLVSEDARLVAIRADDGLLAANRARPNGFTFENWMRALAAPDWRKPLATENAGTAGTTSPTAVQAGDGTFTCVGETCSALIRDDALIVHTGDVAVARAHCPIAALIVLDDATVDPPCAIDEAAVITRRDTAWRGSAAIRFTRSTSGAGQSWVAQIDHSISQPLRPWHDHRRYSREARGLEPWRQED